MHGGGWTSGDKSNVADQLDLIEFFTRRGFVLASINHRLVGHPGSPGTGYADQATDIARAVRWLTENAATYGGRVDGFTLVGYSSGAHLVALTTTDPRYLAAEGLATDILRGSVSLDVPDYHVPSALQWRVGTPFESRLPFLTNLFGSTEAEQLEASPANYLDNPGIPPILLISAGIKEGASQLLTHQASADYKNRLLAAGLSVTHQHFPELDHTDLATGFGDPTNGVSNVLGAYLDRLSAGPVVPTPLAPGLTADIAAAAAGHISPDAADRSKPTGLVVGVVRGDAMAVEGFGTIAAGSAEPVGPHHFFSIGSVTKVFTGLALAQAEIDGLLSIDDLASNRIAAPIGPLLDGRITLGQLVSHTSGLPNFPANLRDDRDVDMDGVPDSQPDSPARNYGVEQLQACFEGGGCPMRFAPGTQYAYSNLGVGLLGAAVIEGTGVDSYDRVHQSAVTWGLEMDDTGILTEHFEQKIDGRGVTGYMGPPQAPQNVSEAGYAEMGVLAGGGGLISTGADMTAWLSWLARPGSAMPRDAVEIATTPLFDIDAEREIAYAIDVSQGPGGVPVYAKGGATPGFTCYVIWRPDVEAGVVVLTNRGSYGGAPTLAREVLDLVTAP